MKKYAFVVAASLITVPAYAQDEVSSFTGPRAEVRVGADIPTLTVTAGTAKESASEVGLGYGLEIGYDFNIGTGTFAGVYAGIDGSTVKSCDEWSTGEECLKAGRNFSVGARVGFEASKSAAVYVKGGYTNARIRYNYEDSSYPSDNETFSFNRGGFQIGAGAQFNLSGNTYAKLEYVYSDYADYKTTAFGSNYSVGLTRHQAVAGFGVRF